MKKIIKISDVFHSFPIGDFNISDDLNNDIVKYAKYKKMPLQKQNTDDNAYISVLFRLGFGKRMTVHTLTDGVIKKVKNIKIENMPNRMPKLMEKSFLFEAKNDNKIFDNINSIGGVVYNNELFLLIGTEDENFYIQHEKASYDGRNIEDINIVYKKMKLPDSIMKLQENKETFAFVTILSLMLEAEKTPLTIESKQNKKNKNVNNRDRNINNSDWITKHIYIDKKLKYKSQNKGSNYFDKDGKILEDVKVEGFLRKQHYGKNSSEIKWIYIDSFDSRRWKTDKDVKIVVDNYEKIKKKT